MKAVERNLFYFSCVVTPNVTARLIITKPCFINLYADSNRNLHINNTDTYNTLYNWR